MRNKKEGDLKRGKHRMHREIMNCPDGMVVDHINHNKLDNRKENLRICTSRENARNSRKSDKKEYGTSYKGVRRRVSSLGQLKYRIKVSRDNGEDYVSLTLTDLKAAVNAYNYYAKDLHGEFACLNEIEYMEKEEWEKYIEIRKKSDIRSKYIGVGWNKRKSMWRAYIGKDNKNYHLGYFDSEEEAALAYNKAIIDLDCNYKFNEL